MTHQATECHLPHLGGTSLEEMVAHKSRRYVEKHQAVTRALEALKTEMTWEPEASLEKIALDRHQEHWRKPYSEIFEVLETSGEAAKKALAREAMGLPPTKPGKPPTGGRDAAIWFSVIEYLEANPHEDVYFVTNNHKDFGDGSAYPYPMDEDLPDSHRLTILKSFDEVVARFTQEVDPVEAVAAEELLHSPRVRDSIAQAASELGSIAGFPGLTVTGTPGHWHLWMGEPDAEILRISDVTGHRIEEDTWYTATTDWLLSGPAARADDGTVRRFSCVWSLKILFSTQDDGDEPPTLLTVGDPHLPGPDDRDWTAALARVTKRATKRRDTRPPTAARHPRPTAAGFDLASMIPTLDLASALDLPSLLPKGDHTWMIPNLGLAATARNSYLEGLMPDLGLAAMARNAYLQFPFPDLGNVSSNATRALQEGILSTNPNPSTTSDVETEEDSPDKGESNEDAPKDE